MGRIRRSCLRLATTGAVVIAGFVAVASVAPPAGASPLVFSGKPGCTNNTSTQSGATITGRGNMTGCYTSTLTITRTITNVNSGALIETRDNSCSSATSCPLADYTFNPPDGLYQVTVQGCSSAYTQCDSVSKQFLVDTGCCVVTNGPASIDVPGRLDDWIGPLSPSSTGTEVVQTTLQGTVGS